MASPIEFFFEFSSPYGYLASELIEPLAEKHGVEIVWRPFLLGAVFKIAGTQPLTTYPLKGDYAKRDMARSARQHDVPFRMPEEFPFMPVPASRATYWALENAPDRAVDLIHALYRAAFAENRSIAKPAETAEVAGEIGLDRDEIAAGMAAPTIKDRLRKETDDAIARGVFGSPFFFYEGEPFWGNDRMPMLSDWIETGGW